MRHLPFLRFFAIAALPLSFAGTASAVVLTSNPYVSTSAFLSAGSYYAQGFVIEGSEDAVLDSIYMYTTSGEVGGEGNLYVLDSEYTGVASAISGDCVGVWDDTAKVWDFSALDETLRTLSAGHTYYFYSGQVSTMSYTASSASTSDYTGGILYFASASENFTSMPDYDFYFVVNGSAVPEPASVAALAGLGVLGFAALRRRKTVSKE